MKYPSKFQTHHQFLKQYLNFEVLRDLSMRKESSYRSLIETVLDNLVAYKVSLIETVMDNLVAYKVHESPCKLCVTDQG